MFDFPLKLNDNPTDRKWVKKYWRMNEEKGMCWLHKAERGQCDGASWSGFISPWSHPNQITGLWCCFLFHLLRPAPKDCLISFQQISPLFSLLLYRFHTNTQALCWYWSGPVFFFRKRTIIMPKIYHSRAAIKLWTTWQSYSFFNLHQA